MFVLNWVLRFALINVSLTVLMVKVTSLIIMSFTLNNGQTSNVSSTPTKFLGETIGATPNQSKHLAGKKLCQMIYSNLKSIDERPIRGEYKIWIYKAYLTPSIRFNLTVDRISQSIVSKIQTKITSYLKKWLSLPRCATLSSLFHPDVLNLPYIPHEHEKAKLRLLASASLSSDANINSLESLITSPEFIESQLIPSNSVQVLTSHGPPTLKKELTKLYSVLKKTHSDSWNSHLESLSVQRKFLEVIPLEAESRVWTRIISSLPAGQLSFMIRAGIDCLPSPINLSRWKYRCDPSCNLCQSSPCTVHHILNCCPVSLNQGRYTWRHDSVLRSLFDIVSANLPSTFVI